MVLNFHSETKGSEVSLRSKRYVKLHLRILSNAKLVGAGSRNHDNSFTLGDFLFDITY